MAKDKEVILGTKKDVKLSYDDWSVVVKLVDQLRRMQQVFKTINHHYANGNDTINVSQSSLLDDYSYSVHCSIVIDRLYSDYLEVEAELATHGVEFETSIDHLCEKGKIYVGAFKDCERVGKSYVRTSKKIFHNKENQYD